MKTRLWMLAGTAGLLLTACVPSVNPFYTDKDVAFERGLVGSWRSVDEDDGPEQWKFGEAETGRDYRLTVTEKDGKQGEFRATLFELGDHQFLDLIPTDCSYATNQAELVAVAMVPGHLVLHVAQIEPSLKLAFMDVDWVRKHLEENPRALAHRVGEGDQGILLTASTRDLQRFLLKHLEGGQLFSDYGELQRGSAAVAPESSP